MDFSEYQERAKTTAIYPDDLKGRFFYPCVGLAGEVGELLNKVKKLARDNAKIDREDLKGELGDIMWYVSQISTELGIDMNDVVESNLAKLRSRQERGKLGGSGDDR